MTRHTNVASIPARRALAAAAATTAASRARSSTGLPLLHFAAATVSATSSLRTTSASSVSTGAQVTVMAPTIARQHRRHRRATGRSTGGAPRRSIALHPRGRARVRRGREVRVRAPVLVASGNRGIRLRRRALSSFCGTAAPARGGLMVSVALPPVFAAAAPSTELLARLRPHLVNLTDGVFSTSGAATTSASDIDAIMDVHLPAFVAAHGPGTPVLLWAHGGLVDEAAGIAAAARKLDWLLANGIYPIFFVWEGGIGDAVRVQLLGRLGTGDLAGLFAEIADAAIVAALRLGGVGAGVWSTMKRSAERASATGGGAAYVAAALGRFVAEHPGAVTLHAAGHSAGAVFHGEFVPAAIAQGLSFPTVSLLAPAIRVDTFTRTLAPTVVAGDDALTVYTMRRDLELRDTCALGPPTPYHHSLLYLIRAALEDAHDTPILGLQESLEGDPATAALFAGPAATAVWSTTPPGAPADARSLATSHGAFDDDPTTMESLARRVTGRANVTPFFVSGFL